MKKQVQFAVVAGFLVLGTALSAQAQMGHIVESNGNFRPNTDLIYQGPSTAQMGGSFSLSSSPASLSGFSTSVGKPSAAQKYDLTGGLDHTAITAPDGFEISLQEGSGYVRSLLIGKSATIWVRLTGKQAGPVSGSIDMHSSESGPDAMLSGNGKVAVSGTVH